MKKVTIIGAGITGLTTAYELAIRDYQVTVIEQESYSAQKCSYANGGQISVSNSEVWTTIQNVKKGLKWLFKKDAPLYIKPTLECQKIKWLGRFLFNTLSGKYIDNTKKTINLGLQARQRYEEIIKAESIQFDRLNTGILHIYKSKDEFNAAHLVKKLYESQGVEWDIVEGPFVSRLEPALNDPEIIGGAYTISDWTGDIRKFCQELTKILTEKYNVEFWTDLKVDSLLPLEDLVVVCAGVGSEQLANSIEETLHIYPVKGYSITINNCDPAVLPKVSLLDDEAKIVTSTLGNRLRVAGTAELTGENYDITRSRIEPLLKWTKKMFPDLDCSDYSSWACLRPMTPDMLPVVRQSETRPNVWYNTGHGHLGWTLAPATAFNLAEQL